MTQAEEILAVAPAPVQVERMQALIESCPFSVTALAAFYGALLAMGCDAQAAVVRDACEALAAIEAEEA